VTTPCFYDDFHRARLLPLNVFLTGTPATFRTSLLKGYGVGGGGEGECWASVSVREWLRFEVVSAQVRHLGQPVYSGVGRVRHSLKVYRASLQQDEKELMLTILHEHHFSFTQDFTFWLLCV
jgi:hypothetical protein